MALCLHGWVDEDGCAESCDGPQEIAGYCEMHAEFHGEEMVDEIARLRAELEEARGASERLRNAMHGASHDLDDIEVGARDSASVEIELDRIAMRLREVASGLNLAARAEGRES